LCEVQLISNGTSGEEINAEWFSFVLEFGQQPWHDLGTAGWNESAGADGEPAGMVWMLERRSP
jgi:hypothetical protein